MDLLCELEKDALPHSVSSPNTACSVCYNASRQMAGQWCLCPLTHWPEGEWCAWIPKNSLRSCSNAIFFLKNAKKIRQKALSQDALQEGAVSDNWLLKLVSSGWSDKVNSFPWISLLFCQLGKERQYSTYMEYQAQRGSRISSFHFYPIYYFSGSYLPPP